VNLFYNPPKPHKTAKPDSKKESAFLTFKDISANIDKETSL